LFVNIKMSFRMNSFGTPGAMTPSIINKAKSTNISYVCKGGPTGFTGPTGPKGDKGPEGGPTGPTGPVNLPNAYIPSSYLYWDQNWTVGADNVRIGSFAGETGQGSNSVAIGSNTGQSRQCNNSVAIGTAAGQTEQESYSVAIGHLAGQTGQGKYFFGSVGNSIAIGTAAGQTDQGSYSVAIGSGAGQIYQCNYSVAIGSNAGQTSQGKHSVAICTGAGEISQKPYSIAIGENAGQSNQCNSSIAIGLGAGQLSQSATAVAIGRLAAQIKQGLNSVAIGSNAGRTSQGEYSVAIGKGAGEISQKPNSVAIGSNAGQIMQGLNSVAIGSNAANRFQGESSVAIGTSAGDFSQKPNSVAIGSGAGQTGQGSNSIIINATNSNLNTLGATSGFFVKPLRNIPAEGLSAVYYDIVSGEISYTANVIQGMPFNSIYGNTTTAPTGQRSLWYTGITPYDTTINGIQIYVDSGGSDTCHFGIYRGYLKVGEVTNPGLNMTLVGQSASSTVLTTGLPYNRVPIVVIGGQSLAFTYGSYLTIAFHTTGIDNTFLSSPTGFSSLGLCFLTLTNYATTTFPATITNSSISMASTQRICFDLY
jgi:hypothetical protein